MLSKYHDASWSYFIHRQRGTDANELALHQGVCHMKNLIICKAALRGRKTRGVLPGLRQFVPRPTLLCLMLVFGVSMGACAATYYVDYSAGSDSSAGTSTGAAWKHCPGDSAATGTASSTALAPGDTVLFKGGVVYSNWNSTAGITISHSGTAGNQITYDGTGNTWGSGQAVIDGNYLLNGVGFTFNTGVSFITLTGFEIRNYGGYADNDPVVLNAAAGVYGNAGANSLMTTPRSGEGIDMSSGNNTSVWLANLFIHRMGCWRTTYGWDVGSISGTGVWADSSKSLTITNCEISQCGNCGLRVFAAYEANDVLITDCYLHKDIAWGIDMAPYSDSGVIFSNIWVTKTRIVDMNDMGGGWTGTGGSGGGPHMNYIFLRQSGSACFWTNVFITRCWLGETNASPAGGGGTSGIFLSEGPSVNIYNNVFCRVWATGNISPGYPVLPGMTQIIRIFNNTFQKGAGVLVSSIATQDQQTHLRRK